jgi:hypothetical protein
MAESAFQKTFREETIMGFEKGESLLRKTVTTEHVRTGNDAEFLVADSGGVEAVTRGLNGDIPTRADNNQQSTCTLQEWHDVPEKTGFNIFASQGNQVGIMQKTCRKVINRKIDSDIYGALANATLEWNDGTATEATLPLIGSAKATLGLNFADDGDVWAVITPGYHAALMALDEFTSADYINTKPFEGVPSSKAFNWYGVNWIVDGGLPGAGTGDVDCYMYNKAAVGHAADIKGMNTHVGFDEKNDKSWARCSVYMGSILLQNSGIIVMPHDDSDFTIT